MSKAVFLENGKELIKDERAWRKLAWELYVVNNLIGRIRVDLEYQSMATCAIWDKFEKADRAFAIVRSEMEDRMFLRGGIRDTHIFYPYDFAGGEDPFEIIDRFRKQIAEHPFVTAGKEQKHEEK